MRKSISILLILTILGIIPTMLVALISKHIVLEIILGIVALAVTFKNLVLGE